MITHHGGKVTAVIPGPPFCAPPYCYDCDTNGGYCNVPGAAHWECIHCTGHMAHPEDDGSVTLLEDPDTEEFFVDWTAFALKILAKSAKKSHV